MAEPIVPALIPPGALAACPHCGPCVLVRAWMPLATWTSMTAPLVPTDGDWHWCVAPPAPREASAPPGDVPCVPDGATPLPRTEAPEAALPAPDDARCRGALLRRQITDAVQQSGRPVDVYWLQTCNRCRVQAPGEISVRWLEGLLTECEAVLAQQMPPPPASPPEKRPRTAQAALTPPDPTREASWPRAPHDGPGTPSWRLALVALADGTRELCTQGMDADLRTRVETAVAQALALADAPATTPDEAHALCEVLGHLTDELAALLELGQPW